MFSAPTKSTPLKQLEILRKRTTLSLEQQRIYARLSTGYIGELHLSELLHNHLNLKAVKLFDLHLKIGESECQIDSLLIFQNECILLEVKHYQGDFTIKNDGWYMMTNEEIKNPIAQLQRTELLLKRLFKEEKISLNIRPFILFTNPEFHLYEAPENFPVVFPTQLNRFIQKLHKIPCHITERHHEITERLKSKHLLSSSYESKIQYKHELLKKGVTCKKCEGFMELIGRKHMSCTKCNFAESIFDSIVRSVYEFHTLFPERKITTPAISEWIGQTISDHYLRVILSEQFISIGKARATHYVLDKE